MELLKRMMMLSETAIMRSLLARQKLLAGVCDSLVRLHCLSRRFDADFQIVVCGKRGDVKLKLNPIDLQLRAALLDILQKFVW